MTLLIVLASVAVLEILLKRAQPVRDDAQQAWARKYLAAPTAASTSADASLGLSALSQALDRYGRGQIPDRRPRTVGQSEDKLALKQREEELHLKRQ